MKLNRLYSNKSDTFPPIQFNYGFNVVFACVNDPNIQDRDSHNLGKTFLIDVIDFTLLKQIDKEHPFRKNDDVFSEFEFFIEVITNSGMFVTIRRKVSGIKNVCIHLDTNSNPDRTRIPTDHWSHHSLGIDKARELIDTLINLDVIYPQYSYRKGLNYFLRKQSDYIDEFMINKFRSGKHIDWKPYMAKILGFDSELFLEKYSIDINLNKDKEYYKRLESESGTEDKEYDTLKGIIQVKQATIDRLRESVEGFSFNEIEKNVNKELVHTIEAQISELNKDRYTIDYEIKRIGDILQTGYEFDLDRVKQVFSEAQVVFSEQLVHSYEKLIAFNERMTSGRIERLSELNEKLESKRSAIESELTRLDRERKDALAILKNIETFNKYKALQRELSKKENEINVLRTRLSFLDKAGQLLNKIQACEQKQQELVNKIITSIRQGNEIYGTIRRSFSEYVEKILNAQAILSVPINIEGNPEFKINMISSSDGERETSESRGTSYKKILCACFDLAVLTTYSNKSFFRFVYHDGIFEGLDNRKKVNLLSLIREICDQHGIQYILSVIDSDLPRDEKDKKLLFTDDDIVLKLNDEGDQGRLFKMPEF